VSLLGALNHLLGQFGFGAKGDGVRNMGSAPTRPIGAPVFGQIQLAVDEGMAQGRHVDEKHADLAVFDPSGASAVLQPDASGVAAAFREAAFIQDEHGERGRGVRTLRWKGGGSQDLADQ
jgi:hypothetical protein